MKNRVLDANEVFSGAEPKFNRELEKFELVKTLNWYSQNRLSKDSYKYASDFFRKKHKITINDSSLKSRPATFGFVCRIVTNGGVLSSVDQVKFNEIVNDVLFESKNQIVKIEKEKPVVSIQERLADKISEIIGDLEGMIDDYIQSEFKTNFSPLGVMQDRAKALHAKSIIEHFKKRREEFAEALDTKDELLKEGWSNFKKTELKKVISFVDQIIVDCNIIIGQTVKTKKPRKRKVKTADELVKKLNYCEKFDELNLKSVSPKEIVGAAQVWVYNVKNRKVGVYHAKDVEGISVKGSTLQNFDESKSVQKTVRKPQEFLPEVLTGGKVFLRNALTKLKAVEIALNGRINKEVILLRIIK